MTATSLDFSNRRELSLHARVVAAIEQAALPIGISPLIVGAFARDLHLVYGTPKIKPGRETRDVDFALAVPDWPAFHQLNDHLVASGAFTRSAVRHRLRHLDGLPVDLVPFGAIETVERKIEWPPHGDEVLDVFGFREALGAADEVVLPSNVRARVVSLAALALLKILCWDDRHVTSPRKDAHDLMLVLRNYLQAGHEARLPKEFPEWFA
jgi:predicted nucleotidyltransferase